LCCHLVAVVQYTFTHKHSHRTTQITKERHKPQLNWKSADPAQSLLVLTCYFSYNRVKNTVKPQSVRKTSVYSIYIYIYIYIYIFYQNTHKLQNVHTHTHTHTHIRPHITKETLIYYTKPKKYTAYTKSQMQIFCTFLTYNFFTCLLYIYIIRTFLSLTSCQSHIHVYLCKNVPY